ncbi:MAG: hypothetical protein HQ559_15820 [Lentisphaerae bacterium]|nr:hypothetical protein [Lentisphaerota bacterium]
MVHIHIRWLVLGVVSSILWTGPSSGADGSAGPADMGKLTWDSERLSVRYEAVYKLGPLSLYRPAQVRLVLGDGSFLAPGAASAASAWIIRVEATPPDGKADRSRRIFFRSQFAAAISKETYQLLSYEKRVEEHIRMVVFRSKKDYLEQGLYLRDAEGVTARIRRTDRLAGTVEDKDVRLDIPGADGGAVQSFVNLPALVGRALFQEGYADRLAGRTTPLDAYVVMSVNVHQIRARVSTGDVESPYTGLAPATRVDTTVMLKSRGNEIAPFSAWFADPTDLPPAVQEFCRDTQIQAFPVSMMMELTLGRLIVRATEAAAGSSRQPNVPGQQGR